MKQANLLKVHCIKITLITIESVPNFTKQLVITSKRQITNVSKQNIMEQQNK